MKKSQIKNRSGSARVKEVIAPQRPIQEKASLSEAADTMRALHVEKFPVASGDRVTGLVEGSDADRQVAAFGHDPQGTLVRETMRREAIYCTEEQSLDEAHAIMAEHGLDHLPVVDESLRIVGMLSRRNLASRSSPKKRKSGGKR